MKLIEMKPAKHSLELKRNETSKLTDEIVAGTKTGRKFFCQHNALLVDERRGMATCKTCGDEMSPLEALKLLYNRLWWEENTRERQIEYDEKRVRKVQAAAIEHLHAAGMTPDKYARRWMKEEEKQKVVRIDPSSDRQSPEKAGGDGAA